MYIVSLAKSLKPYRREHWIMLSILVYSLVRVLKYYLPSFFTNVLVTLSALTFIVTVFRNIRGTQIRGITGFFYSFLILWSVLLTLHMFFVADVISTFVEYKGIKTWLSAYFGSPMFLPNLMPFFLLAFPRNYQFDFKYLWRVMWLLCILYACYYPFAFWNMTHYIWSFDQVAGTSWGDGGTYGDFITNSTIGIASLAPVVLMVYFKKYIQPKQWKWFTVVYVGSLLIQAYLARRGGLAMSVLYLVMAWGMYAFNDRRTSKIKMFAVTILVLCLCYMLFLNIADSFFATLMERGDEDTRSGVEESFYADMKTETDWIFGRGWFGAYYDPIFNKPRLGVETGYLTLILRGGLFYFIPYVIILLLSFYNGYFRSNNLFCKSFGILCLMQIINLYPYGWPAFNFFHFFVWLGVWICNNKSIRIQNDDNIKMIF